MVRTILIAIAVLVFGTILLLKNRKQSSIELPLLIWAICTALVGLASITVFIMTNNPTALIVTSFIFLPLLPLHGFYKALLSELSLVESALFAMILPAVGLSLLYQVITMNVALPLEEGALQIISYIAITGALYGACKALVQLRVAPLVSLAGVSLFSVLWWYLAESATEIVTSSPDKFLPQVVFYTLSLMLVTSGILIAWRFVVTRYGDIEINKINMTIGGLATTMPRFGGLFTLIIVAAMGRPPGGLFSGYVELLFAPTTSLGPGMWFILLTWLITSWYFIKLMQSILFGPPKNNIMTNNNLTDLTAGEVMPLAAIVTLLIILGLAPYDSLMEIINFAR